MFLLPLSLLYFLINNARPFESFFENYLNAKIFCVLSFLKSFLLQHSHFSTLTLFAHDSTWFSDGTTTYNRIGYDRTVKIFHGIGIYRGT